MRKDKYAKSLNKNRVCGIHCTLYFLGEILGTMFSKIYKAVLGGIMLVYL